LYLIASICFIQALKGLSHPATARRGNSFGIAGMVIAVLTTLALIVKIKGEGTNPSGDIGYLLVAGGVIVGGGIGAYLARSVEMTKMPELV
ncbi:NAD(P)(+) transhydrogenase (Re/Si-specific) subunit beta, partial [Acinetobacter baumannii]